MVLDSWTGLGAIVVGLLRHGYEFSLTSDENGWRATFLHRSTSITRGSGRSSGGRRRLWRAVLGRSLHRARRWQ